jgi:hypothetical protein
MAILIVTWSKAHSDFYGRSVGSNPTLRDHGYNSS